MDPKPIRMPEGLWQKIDDEASARDISKAEYVRQILQAHHSDTSDTQPDTIPETDTKADTSDASNPDTVSDTPSVPDTIIERLDEHHRRIASLESRLDNQPDETSSQPSTEQPSDPDEKADDTDNPEHADQKEDTATQSRTLADPAYNRDEVERRYIAIPAELLLNWNETPYEHTPDREMLVRLAIAEFGCSDINTPDDLDFRGMVDPDIDNHAEFLHTTLHQTEFITVPETPTGEYQLTTDPIEEYGP